MKKGIFILLFLLSLAVNVFLFYKYTTRPTLLKTAEKFPLVNPIVGVQIDANIQPQNLILHYQNLRPLINDEIGKVATASDVGIFVQDVKTGAWLGMNEQEGFVPASLLKVPLMMAMLKKVERGEVKLTDHIELAATDLDSQSGTLYERGAGASLTVWELLKLMILTSDNTAKNAIKRQLLPVEINAIFAHVGIANPYDIVTLQEVTPRGYVRIFKSLYFASFLNPELSQKALDLTTDTQVESLLSAGIPSEVQVAHKYGERPDGLTDCGVVYHAVNPYYLCVMTRNIDPETSKTLIKNISKIIYTYIDAR